MLDDCPDPRGALSEVHRVLRRGGQLGVTLPLRGTFAEFLDIFREALERAELDDSLKRLTEYEDSFPRPDQVQSQIESAGFSAVDVRGHRCSLLFRSSREFFFAPVVEHGFLPRWKEIAPSGRAMQSVFLSVKKSIDTYHGPGPFNLTVEAGIVTARRKE